MASVFAWSLATSSSSDSSAFFSWVAGPPPICATAPPTPIVRTLATANPPRILILVIIMALDTSPAREVAAAEDAPAKADAPAPPAAKAIAARRVESTRTGGTAARAVSLASTEAKTPEGIATPRRRRRSRSLARAVERRLRTVPTGQERRSAASSWVRPSR